VRGVQDATLLFMVEPTRMDLAAFQAFLVRSFKSTQIVVNPTRAGCIENTKMAMNTAFALGAEFAVLAEEDLAVSDDVLEYFAFTQRYASDPGIAAACAHTYQAGKKSPSHGVFSAHWFSPLVWGTWRDKWTDFIRPDWQGLDSNPQAWDLNLRLQIVHADKFCVFPGRSRSIHRGVDSTLTTALLAEHFYKASLSNCFSPSYPPQDWREIPRSREYELVV
jgi:hypothetical protein